MMKQVRFGPELEIVSLFFPILCRGEVGLILCRYDSTNSQEMITLIKISSIRRYAFFHSIPPTLLTFMNQQVIYHHSHSASSGHYTLDVLHPNRYPCAKNGRKGWVRIDDELVSDVGAVDVFEVWERERD